ncbi:MAG: L-serine ammonia-lyase, iron-sulfur-dependent, subunit alpha [Pirellulaceae bacterium]
MKSISIFNHVLGPVMRGPSSSHTAGAFHIACMARSMLRDEPCRAVLAVDPHGSYAATYVSQGGDRAFAMGLMSKPLTDDSFFTALADAAAQGIDIRYEVRSLTRPDHPNAVEIELTTRNGQTLTLEARSIGGGEVEITRVADLPVLLNGTAYELAMVVAPQFGAAACELLGADRALLDRPLSSAYGEDLLITARRGCTLHPDLMRQLTALAAGGPIYEATPVYYPHVGRPLLASAQEMVDLATERNVSLGQLALEYEAGLLQLEPAVVLEEMLRRYDVMVAATGRGLERGFSGTQLIAPTAGDVFRAEAAGSLTFRSAHTRAAARAMAVMHVDSAMGVVCAAPTGGSAGVIPGALVTLAEEKHLDREQVALALLAAGLVGVIVAQRATFAAEVAGCQVEIGAAGAMASAAVVEASGGTAKQATDAAAIAFQNTMGLVCDLVQGMVEIPCTTRNAVAAANAFVNAELILGGYVNPIPLDQTIDAVLAVGRAMPHELLCTSQGGLAITPAARALKPNCCAKGCCS